MGVDEMKDSISENLTDVCACQRSCTRVRFGTYTRDEIFRSRGEKFCVLFM